jgi:hypothetical protein
MRTARIPVLCLILLLVSACGYQLVREKGIFGGDIVALDIPVFKNLTFEPQISEFFTEAFTRELVTVGLFEVNGKNADSTLQGSVRSVRIDPYAVSGQGIQIQKAIIVTIDLVLTKKAAGFTRSWSLADTEPYNVYDINIEDFNRRDALRRVSARMARRFSSQLLGNY